VIYPAQAQAPATDDYETSLRNGLMGFEYNNRLERVKGNQYFSDWTKGDVIRKNGDVIPDIFLRYDKYSDELLWLRETDFKAGVLPRGDISGFVIYNEHKEVQAEFSLRKIKLPYKPDSSEIFLQVLAKGKLELLAYRKVVPSGSDYTLRDDNRYLVFDNDNSYFVGATRRQLFKVPGIEVKMKSLLKTNRIKLDGTEYCLIRVIDLYNRSK
jgi:hypothetical protein